MKQSTAARPTRDNYLMALNALVGSLAVTEFKSCDVFGICTQHAVPQMLIHALMDMGFIERIEDAKGLLYKAARSLYNVTPEQAINWTKRAEKEAKEAAQQTSTTTAQLTTTNMAKKQIIWHSPLEELGKAERLELEKAASQKARQTAAAQPVAAKPAPVAEAEPVKPLPVVVEAQPVASAPVIDQTEKERMNEEKVVTMLCEHKNCKERLCEVCHEFKSKWPLILGPAQIIRDTQKTTGQKPPCTGNCGMNYCDEHGCVDQKQLTVVQPLAPKPKDACSGDCDNCFCEAAGLPTPATTPVHAVCTNCVDPTVCTVAGCELDDEPVYANPQPVHANGEYVVSDKEGNNFHADSYEAILTIAKDVAGATGVKTKIFKCVAEVEAITVFEITPKA
ncbi:hypothetical protein [Spirosoma sp.]|uniref:hypothetical protein n=1 Tax=Spirosoma sp. TaxID=1899569 RepID=UPI0026078432|nr:hypothetical protein [Spirosoma sp.]MCX6217639.1 hypothetical protein [Spirosoma sp.]